MSDRRLWIKLPEAEALRLERFVARVASRLGAVEGRVISTYAVAYDSSAQERGYTSSITQVFGGRSIRAAPDLPAP